MTERQPDDLYDALRNRLEDYGQEPPAQLWAGIRAKLPPVAQPQLRRRRRWSPALLLGLLLTVAGAASWMLWHKATQDATAGKRQQIATSNNNPSTTNALGRGASADQLANPSASSLADSTVTTAEKGGSAPAYGSSIAQQPSAPDAPKSAATGTDAAVAAANYRSRKPTAESQRSGSYAAVVRGRRPPATHRLGQEPATHNSARGLSPVESKSASERLARNASGNSAATSSPQEPIGSAADAALASTQKAGAAEGRSEQLAATSRASEAPAAGTPVAAAGEPSTGLLAPREVALAAWSYPEPAVQVRPDTTPAIPAVAARRWAAQVLAGPALTHRLLYSGAKDYAAAPYPVPSNTAAADFAIRDANDVSRDEKPAVGFGVQVQVRRVLSGRWAVSSGLGYQEYAHRTTTTQASAYGLFNGPRTGTSVRTPSVAVPAPYIARAPVEVTHRDTYRFLTVPVRFSYALGHPAGRFRYALLAGADAALYLGGSSPGPNGRRQTWDATNSPYRSLNASFSAGLDFRYRLASHWDVVAQPAATYFLNSLPRPASGLTPRYLLGTGAQFGVSYDFR
jgi:hypothetical protein